MAEAVPHLRRTSRSETSRAMLAGRAQRRCVHWHLRMAVPRAAVGDEGSASAHRRRCACRQDFGVYTR
jgi:hypothetical protein